MLRSWENRTDTAVCDEPFYAYYLHSTGAEHPGAREIIERYDTDWRKVVEQLTGEIPGSRSVYYQKHMAHHILSDLDLSWLAGFRVGLLIRDPKEVITSYLRVRPSMTLDETGLPQQVALFNQLNSGEGCAPLVLDAADVLRNPARVLEAVCNAFGLDFEERMLEWSAGSRETDGIWSRYWYSQVEASTGFGPYKPGAAEVPDNYEPLLDQCSELYDFLYSNRLQV